jgi:lipid-binding SYLF domain-containing protein
MQTIFRVWPQAIVFVFILLGMGCTSAPTREEARISDAKVDATLAHLQQKVKGASNLLHMAKGVLVFPGVLEAAFWGGAKYGGEGALRIGGRTVDYYNIVALSFGAQFGAQQKDVIFLFMDSNALQDFRKSTGWTVGVDGKVTLVTVGAEGSITSQTYNKPILAFVVDQKGLIAGVSLEGAKITKRDSPVVGTSGSR